MNGQLMDGSSLRKSYSVAAAQSWVAIKYTTLQTVGCKTWTIQPFDYQCQEEGTKQHFRAIRISSRLQIQLKSSSFLSYAPIYSHFLQIQVNEFMPDKKEHFLMPFVP